MFMVPLDLSSVEEAELTGPAEQHRSPVQGSPSPESLQGQTYPSAQLGRPLRAQPRKTSPQCPLTALGPQLSS